MLVLCARAAVECAPADLHTQHGVPGTGKRRMRVGCLYMEAEIEVEQVQETGTTAKG